MEAHRPRKQLALDTNVLMDLAAGTDFAHDFKEVFQRKGYTLRVPPTALAELHEQSIDAPVKRKRDLAQTALLALREWDILPLTLSEVEMTIAERVANRLLEKRLLPEQEFNDALILSEAALAGVPLLVTSDNHLLEIDQDALTMEFSAADLSPSHPVHPKGLLKAMG